jgi:mRNA-degrading endonuclease RelE of RelBE toxin-antitoxin system
MWYEIFLAPDAVADLRRLPGHVRAEVTAAIGKHLRHASSASSRSRIKKLKGADHPRYRLRVGEVRVFYDVDEGVVEVIAIVPKSEAADWLERVGR